jgi:hypothetical protein
VIEPAHLASALLDDDAAERDLAIGIVGSMVVCTALYLVVAAAAIGARPVASFAESPEPLALILREMGQGTAAQWIAVSAVVALPTVLLAFLFGQSRIFLGMARDGLLPRRLAKVSSRGVPAVVTIFTGSVNDTGAGYLSHTYTSQYSDPATGASRGGKTHFEDTFQPLTEQGPWVLTQRVVQSTDAEGKASQQVFRFEGLEPIGEGASAD